MNAHVTAETAETSNDLAATRGRAVDDAPPVVLTLQQRAAMLAATQFLGVPLEHFESGGREQLTYLLRAGLNPHSKVCDVGCGVLRAGYWLIHFLDADCYCGIEPHTARLKMGLETILEQDVRQAKRPRFDANATFDASVFRERFDFFLAYSIWTHASKRQIRTMLDSFVRCSTDDAVFLTTFLPASWRWQDYAEDAWRGTSHESNVPGCIRHRLAWIKAECALRDLVVSPLGRDTSHGQYWLEIRRRATAPARKRRYPYWLRRLVGSAVPGASRRLRHWQATESSL
jgi:hypothetical protein